MMLFQIRKLVGQYEEKKTLPSSDRMYIFWSYHQKYAAVFLYLFFLTTLDDPFVYGIDAANWLQIAHGLSLETIRCRQKKINKKKSNHNKHRALKGVYTRKYHEEVRKIVRRKPRIRALVDTSFFKTFSAAFRKKILIDRLRYEEMQKQFVLSSVPVPEPYQRLYFHTFLTVNFKIKSL